MLKRQQVGIARRLCRRGAGAILAGLVTFAGGVTAAPAPTLAVHDPGAATQVTSTGISPVRKDPSIDVEPALVRQLQAGQTSTFAIEFRERPDLSPAYSMEWVPRGRWVTEQLQAAAERSQAAVRKHLDARGARYQAYWAMNVIIVERGGIQLFDSLMQFPEIERLRTVPKMKLIEPEPRAGSTEPKLAGSNIAHVGADQVWAQGITGQGAVVGVIDSGVRYSHEALVNQYRGNLGGGNFQHEYNWFDPVLGTTFPAAASAAAGDAHGTHVAGTILGDDFNPDPAQRNQVGVAPGAKWIACQGFPASGSVDAALLGCGQFMLAPHDFAGANPQPDLRPMAVNNSWGDCRRTTDNFYKPLVAAWNAAGIIPVFAGGNASNCGYSSPPGLNTVGNPGRYTDVFTVGSSGNSNGQYAPHSNWGPTDDIARGLPDFPDHFGYPDIKPNVIAPGVSIRSTVASSDSAYASAGWTGTSMSTPHVVGLMALMFEAGECLIGDFATVGTLIIESSNPIDYASNNGSEGPGNLPNYATGWGEINVPAAVAAAQEACGPSGWIGGTVTASGGAPIANALIEIFEDENERVWSATTDENGVFHRRVPELTDGGYVVRVSAFGFVQAQDAGILVVEDQTTTVDFVLDAATFHTVSGRITDAQTGWPLHARIDVLGYPSSPIYSDAVSGEYSVDLPEGMTFPFTVTTSIEGYGFAQRDIGPLAAAASEDFALTVDVIACSAPGYTASTLTLLSEDFETGSPPAGWSRSSNGVGWLFGTDLGSPPFFPIPAHTRYAASNDDDAGPSNDASVDFLVSPSFDLSSVSVPVLNFASYFTGAFGQLASVQYSIDGGSTWLPLGVPTTTTSGWNLQTMSLVQAAGEADVRIRFHADDDGDWASGWAIDDVVVSAAECAPPAGGGLVVGRVLDGNTGAGLNGVDVTSSSGDETRSIPNDDPLIGDGFFAVHAAAGAQDVTATPTQLPAGYVAANEGVLIVDGENVAQDLVLHAGQLVFDPAAGPAATLELGTGQIIPLNIANTGQVAVEYALHGRALAQDFEQGVSADGWTVVNHGGTCVWTTNAAVGRPNYAGGEGLSAAADSDACGSGTTMNTSLVSPRLDLTAASSASLSFVLAYRHLGTQRLDVDVTIDGGGSWTTLTTINASQSAQGPGTPISIDLSAHTGFPSTHVRFRFVSPGWNWYAQVDRIRLFTDGFALVPWFNINPRSGLLGIGADSDLAAAFASSAVSQPGVFTTPIRVVHDTPYPIDDLTATMTVVAPPDYATVSGIVRGLGACDADPAPLAAATVQINGASASYTVQTAADGSFSWQLPAAQGPLTVTAIAAGHVPDAVAGVALSAGATSTASIDLRTIAPCLSVLQDSLSAIVGPGGVDARAFTLVNSGAGLLDAWTAHADDAQVARAFRLTQSLGSAVNASGARCGSSAGTAENFYLRTYDLASERFHGPVALSGIRFGVREAVAGSGSAQPAEVRLYRLDGALQFANMSLLATQATTVPNGNNQLLDVAFSSPVTVGPDDVLVAVLYVPAAGAAGHDLFPGTNPAGETSPSYIASSACAIDEPTPYAAIGFPDAHLRLDLLFDDAVGCYGTPVTPSWLTIDPGAGAIAANSSVAVDALIDAAGLVPGSYAAAVCIEASDAANPRHSLPVLLDVVTQAPHFDLVTSVGAAPNPVNAGSQVTFTVLVANDGPDAATSVNVSAAVPAGASHVSSGGGDWACALVGGQLDCNLAGSIAASATAPALDIVLTATSPGILQFSATASAAGVETDPADNTGTAAVTVNAIPTVDLAVSLQASPSTVTPGGGLTVNVGVANVGGATATGVAVELTLPGGFALVGATGTGWSCAQADAVVTCTLTGTLAPGIAPLLGVSLAVDAGAGHGTRSLAAVVSADQDDGNPGNNSGSIEVTLSPLSDLIFRSGFEADEG